MIKKAIKPVYVIVFLILFYSVGIAGLLLPAMRDLFVRLTPLSLLMSFILLMLFYPGWSARTIIFSLVVFMAGFMFEALGVATGKIFGEYTYGSVLGIKLWDTPLMIGINWLMLTCTTWDLAGRIRARKAFRVLAASGLMVVLDLLLEPVAMKMGMWSWAHNAIPFRNYIAWFLISGIFFSLAAVLKIEFRNKISVALWFILFIFFLLLNLFNF
jgi:putative membrane protein